VKELTLQNIHFRYLIDVKNFWSNLISLHKIGNFIRKNLRHRNLEDLPVPFYTTATNDLNGSQHTFKNGDIVTAILAANSIPTIFAPVIIDGIPFVNGGLEFDLYNG
jgi:NTE family protein